MPYTTGQDLKRSVLFSSGEANTGSKWNTAVMDYINRAYRTLCAGASEFLPEQVTDWWWMRDSAVLTLLPVIDTGTVSVTQDSANIVFSSAPAIDVDGFRFRVDTHPEVFKIATHTAASPNATLDSPYTGPTSGALPYKLMKVEYALSVSVNALISPMLGYRNNGRIQGLTPERMDDLWPLAELSQGVPTAFALEDPQTVRFSHGGRTDGQSMRVEYRFRPIVDDLTDSPSSTPLVPLEYRAVLADMATATLMRDKNDSRDQSFALSANQMLQAMTRENRRRIKRMNDFAGHIFPRQGGMYGLPMAQKGPLRTESGLIIG